MQLHERITKLTRKIKHWSLSETYPKAMAHLNHSIDLITGFYQRVILISGCYTHWRCYLKCFQWVQFHLWPVKRLWLHDVSHQLMRIRERLLLWINVERNEKKNGVGKSVASEGSNSREPETGTSVCAVGFQIVGFGSGSFLVGFLFLHHVRRTGW